MIQIALIRPSATARNISTAFSPGFCAMRGAVPEVLHGPAVGGVFDLEMAGQGIGQPADFAPTHGIGLAGDRKRPHAGATDAARGKVAVQDRIDLVGAAFGLVDALRIDGDDLFRADPEAAELGQFGRVKAGQRGVRGAGSSQAPRQGRSPWSESPYSARLDRRWRQAGR